MPKEVDDPTPGDGEVLVDVEAVGVNYRDVYEREGRGYGSTPPAIIGVEGAGTIAGTGERVAWVAVAGSYAEQVARDRATQLVPIPDGVDTDVAAAAILQGMTAHYLAFDSYPVQAGDWVVVHAAAGGVGLLLTQLAKLRGGRVIATTSTDEKAAARARGRRRRGDRLRRVRRARARRSPAARAPRPSTTASARPRSWTGSTRSGRPGG